MPKKRRHVGFEETAADERPKNGSMKGIRFFEFACFSPALSITALPVFSSRKKTETENCVPRAFDYVSTKERKKRDHAKEGRKEGRKEETRNGDLAAEVVVHSVLADQILERVSKLSNRSLLNEKRSSQGKNRTGSGEDPKGGMRFKGTGNYRRSKKAPRHIIHY